MELPHGVSLFMAILSEMGYNVQVLHFKGEYYER